jgi:wyosine [tRNA(Phe)-imidazoG37] synthetase (radical SAM superfamily)
MRPWHKHHNILMTTGPSMQPFRRDIAYGPIHSTQFGFAIGVNILPAYVKVCSFNCPYCQYGWTEAGLAGTEPRAHWTPLAAIVAAVTRALQDAKEKGLAITRLLIAGAGEPTLHPRFEEIVLGLMVARDEFAPEVPLAVVSNSSTLDRLSVKRALHQVDERYMQLDAGDDQTLRLVSGTSVAVGPMVEHLRDLGDVVVRTVFVTDHVHRITNVSDTALGHWMSALSIIRPTEVHIATLRRRPAWPYLVPVPETKLHEIAGRLEDAGVRAKVFVTRWTGKSTETNADQEDTVVGCG